MQRRQLEEKGREETGGDGEYYWAAMEESSLGSQPISLVRKHGSIEVLMVFINV